MPVWLLHVHAYGGWTWQVYQVSIGAACGLAWPADRIIVQVLDDSTDLAVKVRRLLLASTRNRDRSTT